MTDRYERIRKALADMDAAAEARNGVAWRDAHARFIVHVPPDTIRELLEERDALAAENERLKEDRARFPSKPDDIGRIIEAHIGNLKTGKKCAESLAGKAFDRAFRAESALAEKDKEIAALRKALDQIEQQLNYGQIDTALHITRAALKEDSDG